MFSLIETYHDLVAPYVVGPRAEEDYPFTTCEPANTCGAFTTSVDDLKSHKELFSDDGDAAILRDLYVRVQIGKHVRLMVDGELQFAEGTESDIDGTRRDGLWPNEYAGNWDDSQRLMIQLAFGV